MSISASGYRIIYSSAKISAYGCTEVEPAKIIPVPVVRLQAVIRLTVRSKKITLRTPIFLFFAFKFTIVGLIVHTRQSSTNSSNGCCLLLDLLHFLKVHKKHSCIDRRGSDIFKCWSL